MSSESIPDSAGRLIGHHGSACHRDVMSYNRGGERGVQTPQTGGEGLLGGEKLWSTKRLMIWCRHHGYTPLDPGENSNCPYFNFFIHNILLSAALRITHFQNFM